MTHTKGFKNTVGDYMREVDECKKLVDTKWFRPPYGQLKRSQYKALIEKGYKIALWDVISYDFEKITPEQCANNVLKNTREGSIVLFHDNIKAQNNLKYALPLFLEHFLAKNYTFSVLA